MTKYIKGCKRPKGIRCRAEELVYTRENGILLQDPEQVRRKWKEFDENLYEAKLRPKG